MTARSRRAVGPRCPICKANVGGPHKEQQQQERSTFPFCSERCRLVDLGNWLGGNYAVAEPLHAGAWETDPYEN